MDRREFLRVGGLIVSSSALVACNNSYGPQKAQPALRFAERKNEALERALFRHTAMDKPPEGHQLTGAALPRYFISATVPIWDPKLRGIWRLEVGGLVRRPLSLTLDDLQRLPRTTTRVNHYCVEGWTAIEEWTGCRLSDIAQAAAVTPDARYVDFESFDNGYHESWDIESALHPQTVVAYGLDGRMLDPGHGAPARVFSPIKLGYKNTKYLTRIMFLPHRTGGYWSDQGYEWYAGV